MNGKNTALLLIILFIVVWFIGGIYYYTCHLKNACGVSTSTYVEKNRNYNYRDEYRNDYKRVESTQKKVTRKYTCSAYLKGFIKYGNRNSVTEVAKLEKFLIDHRGADVELDGYYSTKDRDYVKQLQGEKGQTVDGVVGRGTREAVNEIYCKAKVKEYKKNNN